VHVRKSHFYLKKEIEEDEEEQKKKKKKEKMKDSRFMFACVLRCCQNKN